MNIYEFDNYKDVIRAKIEENQELRGYRQRLAEKAGCQRSFLSQALNSHIQLTLDHGAGLADFWELDESETSYFLDLMNLERASSPKLKKIVKERIARAKKKSENLTEKFRIPRIPPGVQEALYYSSWYYAAIHTIIGIKEYRSVNRIAERFRLPPDFVEHTLTELADIGLVKKERGKWIPVSYAIHLPKESPLISVNHSNWRQIAVSKLQTAADQGVHYTGVLVLSKKDAGKIKQMLLEYLDRVHKIVAPSEEEELVCLNCDLFDV